jgi:putative inorganic carbon (HCO3(-)) transporter
MGLFFGLLYVFATFVRPQDLFIVLAPYNTMDILAALALGGAILDVLAGRSRPALTEPQVLLLVGFIGWASLSVILVLRWFGGAWLAFQELSVSVFLFLVLVLAGTSLRRLQWFRGVLIGSMILVTTLGVYAFSFGGRWASSFVLEHVDRQADSGGPTTGEAGETSGIGLPGWLGGGERPRRLRALGFLNDPNDLTQVLIAVLPLVALGWRRRRPFRNLIVVALPVSLFLYAIWLTRSRGGLLALAAVVGFALSARYAGRLSRLIDALGWAGLLASLVAFFRLGLADASALGRREAWSEGLAMLRSSPLWGAGFGAYGERDRVAHNSYVHCFGELGLVGYGLWLGAILVTLQQLDGLRRLADGTDEEEMLSRWGGALRLSLISFLVSSLFLSRTYSPTLFLVLGLPTALAGVAHHRGYRVGPRHPLVFAFQLGVLTVGTVMIAYVVTRLTW